MKLVLVLLVLVSTCGAEAWTPPWFCHNLPCPPFKVIQHNAEYEERRYEPSEWITTKIGGEDFFAFMAARGRLKGVANYKESWPAVIWVTNEKEVSLAWFVAPNSNLEITDPSVKLQKRAAMTVFVKSFRGFPTIGRGQAEKKKLCDMLPQHCSTSQTFAGAGYDSISELSPYSEIWVIKNP